MDYERILNEIADTVGGMEDTGRIATYIPELGSVDPDKFGISLLTVDKAYYASGDTEEKFSIQSVAKVLALALALKQAGTEVWNHVGVEPSGNPFNSLVQLEYEKGKPRNPFINAGAIVVCDILVSCLSDPLDELLYFIRSISGNESITYNPNVAASEKITGFRNRALANLMMAFGNLKNDIDRVLDLYFHLCAIEMSCRELAETFLFLAAGGVSPLVDWEITTPRQTKRINALMLTCGFYDEAGEFAFRTGLPGKSGVGGGIAAVHPGMFSVAVWSPRLNEKGNSFKGMAVLEALTTKTSLSIF